MAITLPVLAIPCRSNLHGDAAIHPVYRSPKLLTHLSVLSNKHNIFDTFIHRGRQGATEIPFWRGGKEGRRTLFADRCFLCYCRLHSALVLCTAMPSFHQKVCCTGFREKTGFASAVEVVLLCAGEILKQSARVLPWQTSTQTVTLHILSETEVARNLWHELLSRLSVMTFPCCEQARGSQQNVIALF